MTNSVPKPPKEFLDLADRFVNLANEASKDFSPSRVSAALMYATARYNAFNWLNRTGNHDQSMEQAIQYYCSQYEAMLKDNLQELSDLHSHETP